MDLFILVVRPQASLGYLYVWATDALSVFKLQSMWHDLTLGNAKSTVFKIKCELLYTQKYRA